MTIAVTGASGHIGANLVRMLVERGHRVRALVFEQTAALEGLDVERVDGNVLDPASLERLVDGAETVYHLAGVITLRSRRDPWAHTVNAGGTRNVVQACLDRRAGRLVHFSSIHAFSAFPHDAVVDETRPLCGDDAVAYDRSKAAGERAVMEGVGRGLDAVIVNPTGVLGPHDYHNSAMGRVICDLYAGRMPLIVDGGFNWVDARDVCLGAIAAAEHANAGEKYLLAGHYLSVRDLAALVARLGGAPRRPLVAPMAVARVAAPVAEVFSALIRAEARFTRASIQALRQHQQISWAKAASDLNYTVRPLEDTVADSLAWYDEHGYLRRDGTA